MLLLLKSRPFLKMMVNKMGAKCRSRVYGEWQELGGSTPEEEAEFFATKNRISRGDLVEVQKRSGRKGTGAFLPAGKFHMKRTYYYEAQRVD